MIIVKARNALLASFLSLSDQLRLPTENRLKHESLSCHKEDDEVVVPKSGHRASCISSSCEKEHNSMVQTERNIPEDASWDATINHLGLLERSLGG